MVKAEKVSCRAGPVGGQHHQSRLNDFISDISRTMGRGVAKIDAKAVVCEVRGFNECTSSGCGNACSQALWNTVRYLMVDRDDGQVDRG